MGIKVSAAQAGWLVGHHERMVRWHILEKRDLPATKDRRGHWVIDSEDLARVPGWAVDRERLAQVELLGRRTPSGMVAQVEALQQQVRGMQEALRQMAEQVRAIQQASQQRQGGQPPEKPENDSQPNSGPNSGADDTFMNLMSSLGARFVEDAPPQLYRGPSTVALKDRGPDAPQTFRTKADAARWLSRHGINELTPKTWPGWPPAALTPLDTLSFALERQRLSAGNHRVTWRLHRCTDAACVCQEMLVG